MIRPLLALAALSSLAACHSESAGPTVAQAWVRLPAVAGNPGAAYFTLNGGRGDDKLVRIESALVDHIELHESMKAAGGMAGMMPIAALDLPKGATIAFAPDGRHAMLFGIDKLVKPGTAIPLRFGFASGKTAEAEAKTVAAGEDAPY
jgi:periplasmic copper chaperone A